MSVRARLTMVCATIVLVTVASCTHSRSGPPSASPTVTGSTAPVRTSAGSVAILDLDDYDADPALHPPLPAKATENCAVDDLSDGGANVVGSTGAGGSGLPPGISHGAAVFAQLQATLGGLPHLVHNPGIVPLAGDGAASPYVRNSDSWSNGGHQVVLLGVDTDAYTTRDVVSRLDALVGSMQRAGFTRFVINLSFVVVPCDIGPWLDDAKQGGGELLQMYQDAIAADPGLKAFSDTLAKLAGGQVSDSSLTEALLSSTDLAPVTNRVRINAFYGLFTGIDVHDLLKASAEPPTDPFGLPAAIHQVTADDSWTAFQSEHSDLQVISVGAAGNGIVRHGGSGLTGVTLGFPFAPAIWKDVVSVSAGTATGADPDDATVPTAYTNAGDVLRIGTVDIGGTTLYGTSFAAPRLSALEAVYLLDGGTAQCQDDRPPLGYASVPDQPDWANLSLTTAEARYCTDFAARTTLPTG